MYIVHTCTYNIIHHSITCSSSTTPKCSVAKSSSRAPSIRHLRPLRTSGLSMPIPNAMVATTASYQTLAHFKLPPIWHNLKSRCIPLQYPHGKGLGSKLEKWNARNITKLSCRYSLVLDLCPLKYLPLSLILRSGNSDRELVLHQNESLPLPNTCIEKPEQESDQISMIKLY